MDRSTGAPLGGVAGLGVAEFDVLGDVVGGEADGAGGPGGGDVTVAMERGDGPLVAVADHVVPVGEELAVVASGDDLIADEHPAVANSEVSTGVEFACVSRRC